jgi:CheY-like chemotaxis protein
MSDSEGSAILVVEDDAAIREIVCELLRDEGFDVYAAEDGAAAIGALRHHLPPPETLCLVILDMMLPRSNGVQVLDTLAKLGRYVPVLAVSADREQLARAARAGAAATLEKPYDLDRLLSIVERNCRS